MPKRTARNPKREIAGQGGFSATDCEELAARIIYVGSPYHKRNPADFGLTPPAAPRPGKTLCDGGGLVIDKKCAQNLLRAGLRLKLVSQCRRNGWPKNIWMVHDGIVYEAQLQNDVLGEYHGYPLLSDDPFRETVLSVWYEQHGYQD